MQFSLSVRCLTKLMIQIWPNPKVLGWHSSWNKQLNKYLMNILMTVCFASGATGQSTETAGDDATIVATPSPPNWPRTLGDPPVKSLKQRTKKFEWRTATRQAWLYTGVMHAFRFATEPGTRDSLNGPWFNDWMASVSELRGWRSEERRVGKECRSRWLP